MEMEAALTKEEISTDLLQEEDVEDDDIILQLEDKSRNDDQVLWSKLYHFEPCEYFCY